MDVNASLRQGVQFATLQIEDSILHSWNLGLLNLYNAYGIIKGAELGFDDLLMRSVKKGMGVSTSAHPCCQAFALPLPKDEQRSQPTPSDYIFEYNQPTQTLDVALPLWRVSKLRS